jgi:hypothetical protein
MENIWHYLRANWLSNRVFETHEAIIDDLINRNPCLGARWSILMTVGISRLERVRSD